MAAYVVALRERMIDPAEIATYVEKAVPTLAGVKPIVVYGRHMVLEGAPLDGMAILEFANYESAIAWYNSSAYQDAKPHRLAGADYRVIIVDGV